MHVVVLLHCQKCFHAPLCYVSREFWHVCKVTGTSFSGMKTKILGIPLATFLVY